jgi:hypothetical protein
VHKLHITGSVTSTGLLLSLVVLAFATSCANPTNSPYGSTNNNTSTNSSKGGPPYTVTYANTTVNTTGTAPQDASSYPSGATVTVMGNTGKLSWPPFAFQGWDTADMASDGGGGGGTFYAPGATFTITSNVTLYGTWYP